MITAKQKHILIIVAVFCALLILFVPFFSQGIESEVYLWWSSRMAKPEPFPHQPKMSSSTMPNVSKALPFKVQVWVIKLSGAADSGHASEIVKTLQQQGFSAYIPIDANGKSTVPIYIGPEVNYADAKAIHDRLPKSFKAHATVEIYNPTT